MRVFYQGGYIFKYVNTDPGAGLFFNSLSENSPTHWCEYANVGLDLDLEGELGQGKRIQPQLFLRWVKMPLRWHSLGG